MNNKIAFTDISIIIEKTLFAADIIAEPSIDEIYDTFDEIYGKLMRDYNSKGSSY